MKDLSPEKLKEILQCPSLQLSFVAAGGGDHPTQRLNLRHELIRLAGVPASAHDEFLKLEKIPKLNRGFSSLSHCGEQGVVALADVPVGADLEEISRVQMKIVLRVSQDQELEGASGPASLWAAKEAAYKALRAYSQPTLLSQVEIGGWKKLTSQYETFQLRNAASLGGPAGIGVVFQNQTHVLGIFIFRP
jgi:hypothetical protein